MPSSNELLQNLAATRGAACDPGFAVIVAFDYYDGPERGFALYPSGEGVRFVSLGDSNSRMFRAFELIPILGNWSREVKALQDVDEITPRPRVWVPEETSDALQLLEQRVQAAAGTGRYVGVGSPNLDRISVVTVSEDQLKVLRELGPSPAGFRLAHQLVKAGSPDA